MQGTAIKLPGGEASRHDKERAVEASGVQHEGSLCRTIIGGVPSPPNGQMRRRSRRSLWRDVSLDRLLARLCDQYWLIGKGLSVEKVEASEVGVWIKRNLDPTNFLIDQRLGVDRCLPKLVSRFVPPVHTHIKILAINLGGHRLHGLADGAAAQLDRML